MRTFSILFCLLAVVAAACASTNPIKPSQDKPARLYVESYGSSDSFSDHWREDSYDAGGNYAPDEYGYTWYQDDRSWEIVNAWFDGSGGNGEQIDNEVITSNLGGETNDYDAPSTYLWPASSWPNVADGTITYADGDTENVGSPVILEHCDTGVPVVDEDDSTVMWGGASYLHLDYTEKEQRHAQAKMTLQTGGKALSKRQNLFVLSGSATQIIGIKDPLWSAPPIPVQSLPVPPQNIALGTLGKLGSDGNLYVALEDGDERDVTPTVAGMAYYTFTESQQKYTLTLNASSSTTNADLSTCTPEFCVGQQVTFALNGLPTGSITSMVGDWHLPDKFMNWQTNYSPTCTTYVKNDDLLANTLQTACWFYDGNGGPVSVGLNLAMNNGQYVNVAADGNITLVKASIDHVTNSCSGVNMFTINGELNKVALQYTNGDNGIEMWIYVKRPDNFSGKASITQLVNRQFHWNANILGIPVPGSDVTGGYWLDAEDPYRATYIPLTAGGHPANPIAPIYLDDGPELGAPYTGFYDYADAQDDFHDYVRFQPDGGIPITIGRIDWGWHGRATYSGSAWSLVISTNYINPLDTSDDSFPVWMNVYHGTSGD